MEGREGFLMRVFVVEEGIGMVLGVDGRGEFVLGIVG